MKNKVNRNISTGILWYKPEQWEKVKELSVDSDVFEDTYQEWKENADRAMMDFRQQGISVMKIEIDLDELVNWCAERKRPIDASARSEFVANKVRQRNLKK